MRTLTILVVVAVLAAAAYAGSPFVAAWKLGEAVKHADTVTLTRKVDWPNVRSSLRGSLARYADLMPAIQSAAKRVRPTIWQRVKSAFGYSVLDRFVDTYITPEGLPRLYRMRETQRGMREAAGNLPMRLGATINQLSPLERWVADAAAFLQRLQRAEFLGPFEVELVLRDRFEADRLIVSVFELRSLEWTLTSLRLVREAEARPNSRVTAGL